MDEILYESLSCYYNVLEKTGYISSIQSEKLLLLSFYNDFVFHDYRGIIGSASYHLIERALDCLWGSSCLIPYPDYLKMGRLKLGEMTEVYERLKHAEAYSKELSRRVEDNDVLIADNTRKTDEQGHEIDKLRLVGRFLGKSISDNNVRIADNTRRIDEYGSRIDTIESGGTGGSSQEDVSSQISEQSSRLDSLHNTVTSLARNVQYNSDQVTNLHAQIESLDGQMQALKDSNPLVLHEILSEIPDIELPTGAG